ncbi:c-type cytochrome [Sphingomonas kyeonggiensis]|uniref:Cytochrome c n=1 Tax=Sphingomonas kyeonggiensis TaxID=1268553 RepID=A0A7W6NZ32_9SPHN|nr:cytochrome c family protein [Sphingomonas kyeonggiensis]MBB4100958.1 cytochrome c [Sphingomonas kyeonggiensis]
MDNRFNTIAGWALAGGIAALGLSIASGMYFHAERPEHMGYVIEGVEEASEGGAAAVAEPIATRLAKADVAKGEASFKKCMACHTINQGGANGIGPNLYATMGEGIAEGKGGFAFSDALKAVGGKWDFDKMDAWLTNPRKFATGTKMTFAGIPDAQERANVIAYLNAQGSNLPLPAAPAAGAAPAEGNATDDHAAGGNLSNEATPAEGAPSKDPAAKAPAEKKGV